MGFLDKLKDVVVGPDPSKAPRPNSEPLGGVSARASILSTSGSSGGDTSRSTVTWSAKTLELESLDDARQRATCECWFSEAELRAATTGAQIPVRVDATTGAILGVDYEAWSAEVSGS